MKKKPKMIGHFVDISEADLPPVDWKKAIEDIKNCDPKEGLKSIIENDLKLSKERRSKYPYF